MGNSIALQKKESAKEAINLYASLVEKYNRRATRVFYSDLVFIVIVPVAAAILAGYFSNVAGLFTTLGVGAINAGEKLTKGTTLLTKYWSDRGQLEDNVTRLQLENIAAGLNADKLDELMETIKKYFEALTKASSKQQVPQPAS